MSEDIKKIIDEFDWHIENNESMCCLSMNEVYQLKDYILNLQQKVEWYEGIELNKTIDKFRVKINKQFNDLQQENKQLKEDFAVLKKLQMISNDILNELEEWVKSEYDRYYNDKENLVFLNVEVIDFGRVLDKIQELKEKYK